MLSAWIVYILLSFCIFPAFSITVLGFSVLLCTVAAWLYGFLGCLIVTALCIPYHYLLLTYNSADPTLWKEAFNPFGISAQLLISGAVALLRYSKQKIEDINGVLVETVEERLDELQRLQHYVSQNHETAQILLSHILLGDIGSSLNRMLNESNMLLNRLAFENNAASIQAAKLGDMITDSIDMVQNLEFIDHFFQYKKAGFVEAVKVITNNLTDTVGTQFELEFKTGDSNIPNHIQHQLYRITQEAITNAVRHAQASKVDIRLDVREQTYLLTVTNDGLPLPEKIESGLGTRLMRQRTQQLGGNIRWETTPNGNTRLLCNIPQTRD